jgi:hypothetical protein
MPNVSKLGKGPEYVHVNCSLNFFDPPVDNLWITYDTPRRSCEFNHIKECPICPMFT